MAEEILIELTEDTLDVILSSETISAELTGMSILYHNTLSGLQGGQANQYYHLTAADYDKVINDAWVLTTGDQMTGTLDMTDNPIIDLNYLDFNLVNGVAATEGRLVWNDVDGTLNLGLKGGDVNLQIGLEQLLRGKNVTGSGSTNGRPGRISGASGSNPTIGFSDLSSLATAEGIGLFTEDINTNANGYLTTSGMVRDLNTSGSLYGETWNDGDRLYVGQTEGSLTNVLPSGTDRKIFMGVVLRAHATLGVIWTSPLNIFFLQELSGMSISSPQDGDVLTYESGVGTWTNTAVGSGSIDPRYVAVIGDTMTGTLLITADGGLGIGVSNPEGALHILADGQNAGLRFDMYGDSGLGNPTMDFFRAENTLASPSSVSNLTPLGILRFSGYESVGDIFSVQTQIIAKAAEDWTTTNKGSSLVLSATPKGSTTPIILISYSGTIVDINLDQEDLDFRVRGVDDGILMRWDASTNRVGMGIGAPLARLHIVGIADEIQQVVQGHVSQSANLQEWQNSSGTALTMVDKDGHVGIGAPPGSRILHVVGNVLLDCTTGGLTVYGNTIFTSPVTFNYGITGNNSQAASSAGDTVFRSVNQPVMLYVSASNDSVLLGGSTDLNSTLGVHVTATGDIGIVVQAAASQTANLQEWQNSSGTALSAIGPLGSFSPPSMADGSAPNNSIYYSTTASKLVYKDSGGTVNNLY